MRRFLLPKLLLSMLGTVLIMLSCMLPASARDLVKVGYVDMPNFFTLHSRTTYSGYAFYYMEMLAGYADWDYAFVPGSWDQCVNRLQTGEIDILIGAPGDVHALTNVAISKISMGHLYQFLALNNKVVPDSRELRLGTLYNNNNDITFERMAATHGMKYSLKAYSTHTELNNDYITGDLDGFISLYSLPSDRTTFSLFDVTPVYLLTRKDNVDLYQHMCLSMNEMDLCDPQLRTRLSEQFYGKVEQEQIHLTNDEREYLKQKKKLVVLSNDFQKPYSYFEDGEPKGVIAEIMKRLAEDLDIELEIRPLAADTNSYDLLESGEVDMISDVYSDMATGLKNHVRISTPYLKVDYVPITRSTGTLPKQPVVACLKGHTYTKTYVENIYSAPYRKYYATTYDCLKAVSDGEADITYMKNITAMYNIWQGQFFDLKPSSRVVFSHGVSIAVNEKTDLRLIRILNKEIRNLNNHQVQSIINSEVMASMQDTSFMSTVYHYPVQAIIILGAVFLIIIIMLVIYLISRRRHHELMTDMAYNDYMTGVKNRRWFEEVVPDSIHKRMKHKPDIKLTLVLIGITNWNALSEIHGRTSLAKELGEWAREINGKLWVSKLCLDSMTGQILLLAQGNSNTYIIQNILDTIKHARDFTMDGTTLHTNIRAGACQIKDPNTPIAHLINCASIAYQEIIDSKLKLKMFDETMDSRMKLTSRIEDCMEQALEDNEFELWLQPKYDIATHKCIGAEALVRWTSSKLGKLFPDQFIPVFEHTGFIIQLDFYMLEKTCQWLRTRLDGGKPVVTISVNQSRLHMTEENYLTKLQDMLDRYDLPRHLIELELTETAFDLDNPLQKKHAEKVIDALHQMGFKVSMDDFGSGYSSLMLLNALPLDVMKLDKTMLNASQGSDRMTAILKNSIRMGKDLNMQIICEGVETREQEELLLENDCHYGQGYFYARPMPNKDFNDFLEKHI